jgi:quinol monooxygenase YgiN
MYGTISHWRIREDKQDEFERLMDELSRDRPTGSRALNVYRSDADPREYWVTGVFETREAYTSNAASPEQGARFQRLRALMENDPEWHDGEVVVSY